MQATPLIEVNVPGLSFHMEVKMKLIKWILVIQYFLFLNLAANTPHLVGDRIFNADGSIPFIENVHFTAYIKSNPAETMNSDDPGSTGLYYESGPGSPVMWLVQVGDFPSPWTIGNTLHIDFTNTANGESKSVEIILDEEAVQNGGDVTLPVRLSAFLASGQMNKIVLKWTTESEFENAGFIIERKWEIENDYTQIASYRNFPSLRGNGNSNKVQRYQFIDQNVKPDSSYHYKLLSVDFNGTKHFLGKVTAKAFSQPVKKKDDLIPMTYELKQNYPNPFNPGTSIEFSIPREEKTCRTIVAIVDVLGHRVKTLIDSKMTGGNYIVYWDGRDENDHPVSSGIYIYYIKNEFYFESKRMILLH